MTTPYDNHYTTRHRATADARSHPIPTFLFELNKTSHRRSHDLPPLALYLAHGRHLLNRTLRGWHCQVRTPSTAIPRAGGHASLTNPCASAVLWRR